MPTQTTGNRPSAGPAEVAPARFAIGRERLANPRNLRREPALAEHATQHLLRFGDLALGEQLSRRLRNREGEDAVRERRHDHRDEHPAPRLQAAEPDGVRAARRRGDRVVDQQREKDAGDDRELLQRSEPAARTSRRHFGDVCGRDNGGHPDGDAAEHAEQREHE
jgi:hypothetical protein